MALTEAQRVQVRLYLGWSARYRQMDSRLEQSMYAVDALPDTLTVVTGLLTSLADIDTRLTAAYGRLRAAAIGDITLPGDRELLALRSEGRRLSGRLASTLGVAVRHDVWSGCGPTDYASADGMVGGANSVRFG